MARFTVTVMCAAIPGMLSLTLRPPCLLALTFPLLLAAFSLMRFNTVSQFPHAHVLAVLYRNSWIQLGKQLRGGVLANAHARMMCALARFLVDAMARTFAR